MLFVYILLDLLFAKPPVRCQIKCGLTLPLKNLWYVFKYSLPFLCADPSFKQMVSYDTYEQFYRTSKHKRVYDIVICQIEICVVKIRDTIKIIQNIVYLFNVLFT